MVVSYGTQLGPVGSACGSGSPNWILPVEASTDQEQYYIRVHLVAKTGTKLGLPDPSSDVPFSDFSIAFLISGDKSSSVKVAPCCSNTSD